MTDHPTDIRRIAETLLYEGYLLYPYRASAIKNRKRFNFGVVGPEDDATCIMQTECLIRGNMDTQINVDLRFLHLIARSSFGQMWQEATEREVVSGTVALDGACLTPFDWPDSEAIDGEVVRSQRAIEGTVAVSSMPVTHDIYRVRVRINNRTATLSRDDDERLLHSMVSAHSILTATGGEWISLLDPPDELLGEALSCQNIRTWPVLAGPYQRRDVMLSSPIILYDHPEIAPESPGDLFDATEIDEILSLRVMALTEDEQAEMRRCDIRARALLERTKGLTGEDFMRMHGTMRRPK
jgi:hypothetical protein